MSMRIIERSRDTEVTRHARVIATYMEKEPVPGEMLLTEPRWWLLETELGPGWGSVFPVEIDFDRIYAVEEKMLHDSDQGLWVMYQKELAPSVMVCPKVWHASASHKAKCLSVVLTMSGKVAI